MHSDYRISKSTNLQAPTSRFPGSARPGHGRRHSSRRIARIAAGNTTIHQVDFLRTWKRLQDVTPQNEDERQDLRCSRPELSVAVRGRDLSAERIEDRA